ncbi:MAG: hypothetical protein ABSD43_04105 [Terracidiphilus sp.]|jgi:hypothetical protein
MKTTFACVALLVALSGCRAPLSVPAPKEIDDSEKGSSAYLKTLTDDQRQSYMNTKDEYLKGLKEDPAEAKKTYAFDVLDSQKTLGSLGYGTLFTGVVDQRTQDALSLYQMNRGIFPSGNVDVLTSFALSQDQALLNKRIISTGFFSFFAQMWNRYFSADGAWDYQNKSDYSAQASNIECDPKSRLCKESDAIFGFGTALVVGTKDYSITKWDDYRILAEFTDLPCERDQLEIVRDTQKVTLHMISVDKTNPSCKDLMGEATTIDAHLIDMREIDMQRMTELGKRRDALFLYSDSGKKIIEAAK